MFPPPMPWKSLAPIDLERSYVAFTAGFALRSILRLPSFLGYIRQINRQIEAAKGIVGYSLAADLLTMRFYNLSVWEDDAQLQAFVKASPHVGAIAVFRDGMRAPTVFVRWTVSGAELPLTWADALLRQRAPTKIDTV